MFIKRIAYALALASAVSAAHAGGIFTMQESAITGAAANLVTADKITIRYEAGINQTAGGAFTETGFFNVTGYGLGNAAVGSNQLNGINPAGYQLYGTFQVSGTVGVVGTTLLATFTSGNFFLHSDPGQDTTKSVTATGPVVLGGTTSDDRQLASSTTVIPLSQANVPLVGGQAASGGSFQINYDLLALTADGQAFFVDPDPFYLRLLVSGENEEFTPPLNPGEYQGKAEGDASAEFLAVPEPHTVALLGLGLLGILGIGAATRRRKN